MPLPDQLAAMDAQQLREFAAGLLDRIARDEHELQHKQLKIDQLTHEMAVLKRWKFAARSEQWHGVQGSLLEETIEADLEAIAVELAALRPVEQTSAPKDKPKRSPLPAQLPRVEVRHEPEQTTCGCGAPLKRIGEDVSEKLDYTPGVFHVERHIRGKWACGQCQVLIQAPVPAQVIDKGIPTAGLLAQVVVAKYADHQPLYRQEAIFGRAGIAIARSTLAQWVGACGVQLQPLVDALRTALLERSVLHADETPVAMLVPGKGKTHRAYIWSYSSTAFDALHGVVYDFADSRAGAHPQAFLQGLVGEARVRRLRRLQGAVHRRTHRGRLPRTCAPQVPRLMGEPQEPGGRGSAEVLRGALRVGTSSAGTQRRRPIAASHLAIAADRGQAARMAAAAATAGHRRHSHRQGDRLQP